MPGRGLIALGALCSVTVAVAVAGATRADRGRSLSGAAPAAATLASPLSVGPGTSLPGPPVAVAQGEPTSSGEATLWVLGDHAVWEVTIARSGTGTVTNTTPLPPGADPVAIACRAPSPGLQGDGVEGLQRCGGSTRMFVLDRASEAVLVYEPNQDGRLAEKASLAVGSRPSALVFANLNEGEGLP